jgi:hypothetical protein
MTSERLKVEHPLWSRRRAEVCGGAAVADLQAAGAVGAGP